MLMKRLVVFPGYNTLTLLGKGFDKFSVKITLNSFQIEKSAKAFS